MGRMGAALGLCLAWTIGLGAAWGERRALVVGIDEYAPAEYQAAVGKLPPHKQIRADGRAFNNLTGAVKDAEAMAGLLTERYGFAAEQVTVLRNQRASREGLLTALERLLTDSQAGDTAVFFYAGHGSRITNTRAPEGKQIEETLVPADAWRGAVEALPAPVDIRDKRLAQLYGRALARGVRLVVILDACYSGGSWRSGLQTRALRPDQRKWALPEIKAGNPAERGLFLAAAGATQPAIDGANGGFTQSLVAAARTLPGDAPVDVVFARAVALLQQETGTPQTPQLEGPKALLGQPLLRGAPLGPPPPATGRPTRLYLPDPKAPAAAELAEWIARESRFVHADAEARCDLALVSAAPGKPHWRLCRRALAADLLPAEGDLVGHLMDQADRFDRTRRWLETPSPTPPQGTLSVDGVATGPFRLTPGERFYLKWEGPTEATYVSVVDTTLGGAFLCDAGVSPCGGTPAASDPEGPVMFTVSTWSRPLTEMEKAQAFTWAGIRSAKGEAADLPTLVRVLHMPAWLGAVPPVQAFEPTRP